MGNERAVMRVEIDGQHYLAEFKRQSWSSTDLLTVRIHCHPKNLRTAEELLPLSYYYNEISFELPEQGKPALAMGDIGCVVALLSRGEDLEHPRGVEHPLPEGAGQEA